MSEDIKNNVAEEADKKSVPAKEKKPKKNIFNSKKFKHGSLSVVFTVVFVAVIVLLNVILNLVLDRFDVEVDLTEGGLYTIGEEMEKFVTSSESTVKFYFTTKEETLETAGSVYKQTVEFAKKASDLNKNYSYSFVDLLSDPTFAEKYENITEGGIILECEETGRYKFYDIGNEFLQYTIDGKNYGYSEAQMMAMYGYAVTDQVSIAEQELLSGLMSITKVNPVKVAFTKGFGESENPDLTALLEKNTYVIETIDIDIVQSIPEEYDIVIINAPTMDYSIEALNKVDEWLSNGGLYGKNLFYFASTSVTDGVTMPNIDDFLAQWGLEIGMGFVAQTDLNYAYAVQGETSPYYQRAEIVKDTDYYTSMNLNPNATFRAMLVRPVKKLWEENSNFTNTMILQTYGETCVVRPFGAPNNWVPADAEESGQFGLIVEASKVRYDGMTPYYSRVIASGCETFFVDYFLSATNYTNADVAVSLFNTVSGNAEQSITITPKSFTATTYEIDAAQQRAIGLVFTVIIPVIIIAIGIVVWVRRRRL